MQGKGDAQHHQNDLSSPTMTITDDQSEDVVTAPDPPQHRLEDSTLSTPGIEADGDSHLEEAMDADIVAMPAARSQPISEAMVMDDSEAIKRLERLERLKSKFKQYDIEFDETSWQRCSRSQVERVHKSPRMRVRWTCHECSTTFGHDRICAECAHPRCKKCVRYPLRKKKIKQKQSPVVALPVPEDVHQGACHECQTILESSVPECTNCHHRICSLCLQETISESEQLPIIAAIKSSLKTDTNTNTDATCSANPL